MNYSKPKSLLFKGEKFTNYLSNLKINDFRQTMLDKGYHESVTYQNGEIITLSFIHPAIYDWNVADTFVMYDWNNKKCRAWWGYLAI